MKTLVIIGFLGCVLSCKPSQRIFDAFPIRDRTSMHSEAFNMQFSCGRVEQRMCLLEDVDGCNLTFVQQNKNRKPVNASLRCIDSTQKIDRFLHATHITGVDHPNDTPGTGFQILRPKLTNLCGTTDVPSLETMVGGDIDRSNMEAGRRFNEWHAKGCEIL